MKKNVIVFTVIGVVVVLAVGAVLATSLFSGKEVNTDCTVSASELQATDLTPFDETSISIDPFIISLEGINVVNTNLSTTKDSIVFTNNDTNGDVGIYKYDILAESTSPLIDSPNEIESKAIMTGEYIFYQYVPGGQNDSDIYMYNKSSQTTEYLVNTDGSQAPAYYYYNESIYYLDRSNTEYSLKECDINSKIISTIHTWNQETFFRGMVFDGYNVVWADNSSGNWDIYLYDISTSSITCICDNISDQEDPVISGDYVIWHDHRNDYNNDDPNATPPLVDHDFGDIYGYCISTDQEFIVDNSVGISSMQPSIDNNNCAYFSCACGNTTVPGAIMMASIMDPVLPSPPTVTLQSISSVISHKTRPYIKGNWIIW